MEKVEERICQGCGAHFQSKDAAKAGFVDPAYTEQSFCKRCFRIKQYSDFQTIDINNSELYEMIASFVEQKLPIINILDIADLLGSALFDVAELLKGQPIIVLVNKIDIIPRDMRRYEIWEAYIKEIFAKASLTIEQIFFISSKEVLGIRRVIDYLETKHREQKIKIIGSANVGKSSFVQALFKENIVDIEQNVKEPLVFRQPGTTLGELEIPCEHFTIYDTPGVMQPSQLTYHVKPNMLKFTTFTKPIRSRNYPIYEKQLFFIGGYAAVEVTPLDTNSVTFYFNPMLPIHRRKAEDIEAFFEKHKGELLAPPFLEEMLENPMLTSWTETSFNITRNKSDIVISGLGWISIKSNDTQVKIWTIKDVHVYKKNALV